MHRLVGTAKRIEQRNAIVPAANRVVPLKDEAQRYRNSLSSAPKCTMIWMQVSEAKHCACKALLLGQQRHANPCTLRNAPIPDRINGWRKTRKCRIKGSLPLGYCL